MYRDTHRIIFYWRDAHSYRPQFPPLGGTIIKESVFWLITHIYFVAHSKSLYPLIHWIVLNLVMQATHFCLCFFRKNLQNDTNLLFRTPPRQFHRCARNFVHSICWPSWQKAIKRILIAQRLLKLLNNNFLQIWFKTGIPAYVHTDVYEWHETQFTTSPWAPKALCKISGSDHQVELFKLN